MKTTFLATLCFLTLAATSPAIAQDMFDGLSPQERHEKMKSMSPEEREAFFRERKEKWQAMSDAEKLEIIEKQRAERIKAMDEKWSKMSDAEKIKHVEEKMAGNHDGHKKFGKPHHGAPKEQGTPPAAKE